jgi:putative transposase
MNNHYHLVLRAGDQPLWRLMKPLQMRYAQYHGRKTGRHGPLFMDRFKSIVTQDQNYLEELIRYVHLNPVRAGVCKNLNELQRYRWSGHGNLLHGIQNTLQDVKTVLRRFGGDDVQARQRYYEYLKEGLTESSPDDGIVALVRKSNIGVSTGKKTEHWVIGDPKFVRNVLSSAEARRLRISRFELEGANLTKIAAKIGNYFGVSPETIRQRHREGSGADARKAFAYYACRIYGATTIKAGEFLGVGCAAVSAMTKQGKEIAERSSVNI